MVSKKVTSKRKTVWRSLPISVEEEAEAATAAFHHPHQSSHPLKGGNAADASSLGGVAGDDVLRPAAVASCAGKEGTGTGTGNQGVTTTTATITNHASGLVSSSTSTAAATTSYHQGQHQQRSATQYEGELR